MLDIAFAAPAEDFFGLCFFDLLFEVAEDLGEGDGFGSAAWITALQLKAITNRRINFFMGRLQGRLISSVRKGNLLDAKGASTSIHAPFATLGR
jgi:hypothetical protein